MNYTDLVAFEAKIRVPVNEVTAYGEYRGALYYTIAEWEALTIVNLMAQKRSRLDAWIAYVKAKSQIVTPDQTEAQLMVEEASLEEQLRRVKEKLVKIRM